MWARWLLDFLLWLFGWPSTEEFDYFPENNSGRTVGAAARMTHKEESRGRHQG